jgi:hypothetical protein
MKWRGTAFSVLVMAALGCAALVAQSPAAPATQAGLEANALPDYQGPGPEQFLLKGKISKVENIGVGVTGARKVTLQFNGVTHFAVFKSIDVYQPGFTPYARGGGEREFQDSWMTEIAAYQVDRIIGLGMVPATVERSLEAQGSLQWWVESMMAEADRAQKGLVAPDLEAWNRRAANVRLFDNLIYNADNHMNNVLIAADWSLRLIDHSRSFRPFNELKTPKEFTRFSRSLLEGIKKLEKNDLSKKLGKYLNGDQIKALLQRRDLILALARDAVAQRGEAAVLFD